MSGAGASQEKLAQAAQSSVNTITKLADVVKLGAASLGSEDPETQVQLSFMSVFKKNIYISLYSSLESIKIICGGKKDIFNKTVWQA